MSEENTVQFDPLAVFALVDLPDPKTNACLTCKSAGWFQNGEVVSNHCSKFFFFTWNDGSSTKKLSSQDGLEKALSKKIVKPSGVSKCQHNPTFKPDFSNNK